MITLTPSGDRTGTTDTASINASLVLDDVTLSQGDYYIKANASGIGISLPQNRTLQGVSNTSRANLYLVGTSSATKDGTLISNSASGNAKNLTLKYLNCYGGRNGVQSNQIAFTSGTKTISTTSLILNNRGYSSGDRITISGSTSNNGTFTITSITNTTIVVSESITTESAGATVNISSESANGVTGNGGCIVLSGQNAYPTNNITIEDVTAIGGPAQNIQMNSIDGLTLTRVITSASTNPTVSSHGFDFDATAYDKPTTNVTHTDCQYDSFGQECLKYENTNTVTHSGCTFDSYVTLTQDNNIPYADVADISFSNCTFNAWVSMAFLKRRHTPSGSTSSSTPAATLTLGQAGPGTSISCTASAAVFSAGDVGKSISKLQNNIYGFAMITGFTSTTQVTITIVTKFDSTTQTSGWYLAATDNDGEGNVTFTGCTFPTEDSCILGNDNAAVDYGTITLTNNTFSGRNSFFAPSGVYPVLSGNIGVTTNPTLWVGNSVAAKYIGVFGSSGAFPTVRKSVCSTSAQGNITNMASAVYDGYSFNDSRVTFIDDTYNNTFISGFTNGNTNLRFSVESESYLGAIIDGTGSTGAFMSMTGTNNRLVTIDGFYIKNFTGGTSTRGLVLNAATAVAQVQNNYFYNCNTVSNGGCGIRIQNAQSCIIKNNIFDSLYTTTAGNGVAVLSAIIPTVVNSNLIKNCVANGTTSGMIMVQGTAAGNSYVTGNVISGCTGGGAIGISVSTGTAGAIFNIFNNSIYNTGSVSANNDYSIFVNSGTTTCNFSNNIGYSPTQTTNISKTGSGVINYGNNCSPTAISVASGTNNNLGSNITTNPSFTDATYLLIGTTSPCYQTGSNLSSENRSFIRDINGRPFKVPYSIGSNEVKTSSAIANTRNLRTIIRTPTSRTLRTSATLRTQIPK